jgi:hypothetical protein
MIGRRRLAREEKRARGHFKVRVRSQSIVQDDDPERVEHLSLVFVNALDLAVEDAVGIHRLSG